MSKVLDTRTYLISTEIGTMAVKKTIVNDYDIEDLVRSRAISQARAVQFMNIGKQIDGNANLPTESLPAVFRSNEEELEE